MKSDNSREHNPCLVRCPEFVTANDHRLPDGVRLRLLGQVAYLLSEGDCPHEGVEPPEHCPNPVVREHLTSVHIRQSVHDLYAAEKPLRWLRDLRKNLREKRETQQI